MAEINIIKRGSKDFILIDGEKAGFLYDSDLRRMNLEDGQVLDDGAVDELREMLYRRTFNKACSYLETAEYCGAEIRFKLKHSDFADDMIERVIEELYEMKYLDDRRYAEVYIRSYTPTKGRKLIESELLFKKIDCACREFADLISELRNQLTLCTIGAIHIHRNTSLL